MAALQEKLRRTLESLGKRLQTREVVGKEDSPYDNAQRLWRVLAPERKINPLKSAFLEFITSNDGTGVAPESQEQNFFGRLLDPYSGLFPELDRFFVTLSLSNKADDISFKLTVFAPPASPQFTHDNPYPVLKIIELPEQKRYEGGRIPYNVLILGESKLYTGRLDEELVGLDPQGTGLVTKKHGEWSDEPEGDPEWRRHFASETLKLLTNGAETLRENFVNYNQEAQLAHNKRERQVLWWKRSLSDKRQPGAVWPDNINLAVMRLLKSKHALELKGEYPTPSISV